MATKAVKTRSPKRKRSAAIAPIDAVIAQGNALFDRVTKLEQELREITGRVSGLEASVPMAESDVDALVKSRDTWLQRTAEANAEINKLRAEFDRTQAECFDLPTRLDKAHENAALDAETHRQQREQLQGLIAALQERNARQAQYLRRAEEMMRLAPGSGQLEPA